MSDSEAFVYGVFSPRSSRPLERSKPKGQRAFSFEVVSATGNFNKHQEMQQQWQKAEDLRITPIWTTKFTRFFLAAVQNMDSCKLTVNRNKDFVEGSICNGAQAIGWHVNESSRRFQRFEAGMSGFAFNSIII
ncbi:hypothetical protein POTOM_055882 [Populus tomentosa]|uniref:Uncharacterized protein n=1 Tax=Populus tomentosa TaxID=118781 RepID=A0A8X7Y0Y7_POPTO|nr:hypothetical protein POTOM_055882 [Populus tomentosa]